MVERKIRRGQIYDIGYIDAVGSEQRGNRPVVIIQNDELNEKCPTYSYLFISSQVEKIGGKKTHVNLPDVEGLPKKSMVLVEQPNSADGIRLLAYRGKLDEKTMNRVSGKLRYVVGISNNDKKKRKGRQKKLKIELGLEPDRRRKYITPEWSTPEAHREKLLDSATPNLPNPDTKADQNEIDIK